MKTHKFYTLGTLALLLASSLLAGCNSSTSMQPPTSTPLASEKPSAETNTQDSEIHALTKLIGQPDSAIVKSLGEGEASRLEDTDTIIARDYTLTFLDTEVVASAILDEVENLSMLTIYLPDNDFAAWSGKITSLLGEPSSNKQDNAEDNGLQEALWKTDAAIIALRSAYSSLSIEISRL